MRPLLRNLMQGILLTVVLFLAVARRLAKALRFVMVRPQDEKDFKAKPFEELREWLRVTYPKSMLT